VLAFSQSIPSYESSASAAAYGSTSLAASSLATNQAQSVSSSFSFSDTLAGLQAEDASRSSAPVSLLAGSLYQIGTPTYLTQYPSSLPSASGADEPNNRTAAQDAQENPSTACSGASQEQSSVTNNSSTLLSADQRRSASGKQNSATGTKAGDSARQEAVKRHRKANEASPTPATSEAPGDSVAATLLAAANSGAILPANRAASRAEAPDATAGASTAANKNNAATGATSPNALAFAVKLQTNDSAAGGAGNQPGAFTAQASNSAADQGLSQFAEQLQAATGSVSLSPEPVAINGAALAAMQATIDGPTPESTGPAQQTSDPQTNSPQTAEIEATDGENSAAVPAPLRSVQVQINGQDNLRIDLRLVERSGSLSMSVRSLDGDLNRTLQDHLPELMTKLADQPGQAEWWTPKTQMAESTNGPGSGGGSKEDSAGSQGQQSQSGQDSGKQQSGRQSNQPKWVDELAALGNSKTTIKETIWHQ
jgi:hypothetical protein